MKQFVLQAGKGGGMESLVLVEAEEASLLMGRVLREHPPVKGKDTGEAGGGMATALDCQEWSLLRLNQ